LLLKESDFILLLREFDFNRMHTRI
jgi:hypothetical protein